MARNLPRIENLTGSLLIIQDGPDGPLKIPARGSVPVSRLTDSLERLEKREPPVIHIQYTQQPAKTPDRVAPKAEGNTEGNA